MLFFWWYNLNSSYNFHAICHGKKCPKDRVAHPVKFAIGKLSNYGGQQVESLVALIYHEILN